MCRSTPTIPPTGSRYILEDSRALLAVTHQRFADRFPDAIRRSSCSTARATGSPRSRMRRSTSEERGAGADRALLRALHLRHHRPAEGRRGRASLDLQFRPRRRRELRLRRRRPRLSGHVDRLRLLRRGTLGAARRRRDAGSQRRGDQPVRRGTRGVPRAARRHLLLLRADAARLDRARSAAAARAADRRRGLPAGAGQALEPARPRRCSTATARPRRPSPRRSAA